MATNHTGDPTLNQPPSGTPGDGTAPVRELPDDGDALDANSVAQALGNPADYEAWLQSPFPAVGTSLNLPVMPYKNARGQQRFTVNHMGHPDGRVFQWEELWRGDEDLTTSGGPTPQTFVKTSQIWLMTILGSNSRVRTVWPGITGGLPLVAASKFCELRSGGAAGNFAIGVTDFQGLFLDKECSIEFDLHIGAGEDAPSGNCSYTFGFGNTFGDSATLVGAVFEKRNTDTHWFAVAGNGTALSARVDTGVPPDSAAAQQTLKVVYNPAETSDSGADEMNFFIDGFWRCAVTTNLPRAAAAPYVKAVMGCKRGSGTLGALNWLGPVRYSMAY